jgi:hypothetical protein
MKFEMVETLGLEQQDVKRSCEVLEVSRSGYYHWLNSPICNRDTEDERLLVKIKSHWEKSRETWACPSIS